MYRVIPLTVMSHLQPHVSLTRQLYCCALHKMLYDMAACNGYGVTIYAQYDNTTMMHCSYIRQFGRRLYN